MELADFEVAFINTIKRRSTPASSILLHHHLDHLLAENVELHILSYRPHPQYLYLFSCNKIDASMFVLLFLDTGTTVYRCGGFSFLGETLQPDHNHFLLGVDTVQLFRSEAFSGIFCLLHALGVCHCSPEDPIPKFFLGGNVPHSGIKVRNVQMLGSNIISPKVAVEAYRGVRKSFRSVRKDQRYLV